MAFAFALNARIAAAMIRNEAKSLDRFLLFDILSPLTDQNTFRREQ